MGISDNIDKDLSLLKRYFQGNYSLNDFKLLQETLGGNEADPDIQKLIAEHWEEFIQNEMPADNLEHLLHKINHKMLVRENHQKKQYHLIRRFQRIAAILIVPIIFSFVAYMYFHPFASASGGYAEIQCPLGTKTKIELPDGSSAFLNSGSKLKYPVNFDTRKVELVGEAYFEVVHNQQSPFSVNTRNLEVKVLGTKFNVVAYEDESIEEVVLKSGRVDVYSRRGKKLETLVPDQQLALDVEKNKFKLSDVEASQYTSWKDGMLIFRNEDMKRVARRLGRWYNANIIIADPKLEEYTYHATFVDEPLDQVMKMISLTSPVIFIEMEKDESTDNVYRKRNIILKLNPERLNDFN